MPTAKRPSIFLIPVTWPIHMITQKVVMQIPNQRTEMPAVVELKERVTVKVRFANKRTTAEHIPNQ
jgi:hypothetical protein